MTLPAATVGLVVSTSMPTVRPAAMTAASAVASADPTTLGTSTLGLGTGMVTSANRNCSMLSSVSVPLLPWPTSPGVVPLSVTITRFPNAAVGTAVIVYWERGPENTAVSQLSGTAAPQSAGPTTGVTMLRMMLMLPALSLCGSANTSSTRSSAVL